MHEIRYISGSFSLLCRHAICKRLRTSLGENRSCNKTHNRQGCLSKKSESPCREKQPRQKPKKSRRRHQQSNCTPKTKEKDADKKTTTPVQLARMDKSGKPNPAKHHARLAKNDTRPAKSGSIARNEKFTDSVKQSAGKADKHENSEKGLSVRDLQKQIATLQTSGRTPLDPGSKTAVDTTYGPTAPCRKYRKA